MDTLHDLWHTPVTHWDRSSHGSLSVAQMWRRHAKNEHHGNKWILIGGRAGACQFETGPLSALGRAAWTKHSCLDIVQLYTAGSRKSHLSYGWACLHRVYVLSCPTPMHACRFSQVCHNSLNHKLCCLCRGFGQGHRAPLSGCVINH
jgi:hypothetical protein